jgi:hypothetical protein
MNSLGKKNIRTLKKEDLDAILEIDEKIRGENRRNDWEKKLALMNSKSSLISLVAEGGGGVLEFYKEGYDPFRVENLIPKPIISVCLRDGFGLPRSVHSMP